MGTPLERLTERRFVELVGGLGLTTLKLNLQGNRGWPDRIVPLPEGRVIWTELKRVGEEPRPLQVVRHDYLRSLNHRVVVADDANDAVTQVLEYLRRLGVNLP